SGKMILQSDAAGADDCKIQGVHGLCRTTEASGGGKPVAAPVKAQADFLNTSRAEERAIIAASLECGDSSPLLVCGGAGGRHAARSALQSKAAMNRRTPNSISPRIHMRGHERAQKRRGPAHRMRGDFLRRAVCDDFAASGAGFRADVH